MVCQSTQACLLCLIPDLAECFIHIDSLNQKTFHHVPGFILGSGDTLVKKADLKASAPLKVKVLVTQVVSDSNPMDCSLPGSSVDRILQSRILEWVAIPFFRVSSLTQASNLGLPHCWQILYHLSTTLIHSSN